MSEIDWNAKRLIVKMLAVGDDPEEIAERVYEISLVEVSTEEVRELDPRRPGVELPADLEKLYRQTREEAELTEAAETVFVSVGEIEELRERGKQCVEVDGEKIALFHWDGSFFAIADTCTHEGGPLSEGELEDGEVECPWHGARFDLATGDATKEPAPDGVERYETRAANGTLEVAITRIPDQD